MTMRLLLVAGLAALTAGPAAAQPTRLDRLHADLLFTPGAASGGWAAPQVRVEVPAGTLPAADTVLVVNNTPTTLRSRPAGGQWDFTGTTAGAPWWVLQQGNNQANQLYLGVRSEGATFANWDPGSGLGAAPWLELTARKLSGPGEFAVWQTGAFGEINPLVSTARPDLTLFNNRVYSVAGGHDHFNYSFTEAGTYQIAFDAKANTAGGFLLSDPANPLVFTFEVIAPVPEPVAGLAVAAGGLAAARRLRSRRVTCPPAAC
jgi:surface-anchored protein